MILVKGLKILFTTFNFVCFMFSSFRRSRNYRKDIPNKKKRKVDYDKEGACEENTKEEEKQRL